MNNVLLIIPAPGGLSNFDLALLLGYAFVCLAIGFYSGLKQTKTDYLIGSRKLGMIGFVFSVVASYIGGAALVAYSAYVYKFGVSALAVFVGTALGFVVFIPYAQKIRKMSGTQEFLTLSDYFYFLYGKRAGLVSAILLFVVYMGMLLNQFIAGSSILSNISGWSYESSLLFSSSIISIYLFAGGFRSVIKTDIFQYVVLSVILLIIAYLALSQQMMATTQLVDLSAMDPAMSVAFLAFGVLIIFQSSEYWQRVYAAKNNNIVRNGFIWSAVLVVVTGFAITMVGLIAHHKLPGIDSRDAFASGLRLVMPQKFLGAGLVLIFAAIMSSADTIIFVLASSMAKDYFKRLSKSDKTDADLMKITRIFTLVFSLAGFVLALLFRDLVQVIVFITGLGFTIIPAAIASFHVKLKPTAVYYSFLAGALYIIGLVCFGLLIPEYSIASVLLAALSLWVAQKLLPAAQ